MRIAGLFLFCTVITTACVAQNRVEFKPEVGHPTFAVREPVLRIQPNTVLVSNTMMGGYYTAEGGAFPGEVGPFYIEGATTNDTLVLKILKVRPNYQYAASRPMFGCGFSMIQSGQGDISGKSIPTR